MHAGETIMHVHNLAYAKNPNLSEKSIDSVAHNASYQRLIGRPVRYMRLLGAFYLEPT